MTNPASYRPKAGEIPTQPGVYKFRDARGRVIYVGKAKNLRARLSSYFQDVGNLHARTATMVTSAAARRVDGGQHRGRGAPARVQLDQGVRPALQRQVPRRQVLPVAGGHRRRGVPAGHGRPRREEEGHPLLRPLQPRLGDPRDRRPAAAGLPDAVVLQRRLQAVGPDRAPLPARLHRQVLRAVRRHHQRRRPPRHRRRLLRLHGRQHQHVRQADPRGDVRRLRGPRLREGRPAPRRPRRDRRRPSRSRPWCSATAPTPT